MFNIAFASKIEYPNLSFCYQVLKTYPSLLNYFNATGVSITLKVSSRKKRFLFLLKSVQISPCDFLCEREESWCQHVAYRGKHFPESKTLTSQNPKTRPRVQNASQNPWMWITIHLNTFRIKFVGVGDCFVESHVVASSLLTRLSSTSWMMKIVIFLSYSVFDEHHYVKKPWRNLETFESSPKQRFVSRYSKYFNNLNILQQMSEGTDKEKGIYSMKIESLSCAQPFAISVYSNTQFCTKDSLNLGLKQ